MSISISQTDNVGLTVESDPLALKIASNLSDLASAPTARTNLGVAYATDAQAIASSSETTVLTPADYRISGLTTNVWAPSVSGMAATSSGTGANTGSTVSILNAQLVGPTTATVGYASKGFTVNYPSNSANQGYNWSTASGHAVKVYSAGNWGSTLAGIKMRGVFGRPSVTFPIPAPLTSKAYGWEWDFSTRTMNIIANDGTTLTTTPVTWNPTNQRAYEITCTFNGAGNISLYVDGTLLGTSSGGPTGTSGNQIWWQYEIQNEATAGGQVTTFYSNPKVFTTNG
jgi:hypothetical protein